MKHHCWTFLWHLMQWDARTLCRACFFFNWHMTGFNVVEHRAHASARCEWNIIWVNTRDPGHCLTVMCLCVFYVALSLILSLSIWKKRFIAVFPLWCNHLVFHLPLQPCAQFNWKTNDRYKSHYTQTHVIVCYVVFNSLFFHYVCLSVIQFQSKQMFFT